MISRVSILGALALCLSLPAHAQLQATITSTPPVSIFRTLVSFNGTNGAEPAGNQLTEGVDGNLYGATFGGGQYGNGLLFKVTPAGTLTPLYSFCAQPGCADGSGPSPLLLAINADFYGGTFSGGAFGYGTIFEFAGEGTPMMLHSFEDSDGYGDNYLAQARDGRIYGTESYGGNNLTECFGPGCGTVFSITPDGTDFTLLYTFCSLADCADGSTPFDTLAQGANGDFYGTTFSDGGPANAGTVFKIKLDGSLTTLYSFCVDYPTCSDGSNPIALALGNDGDFYGTTFSGGKGQGAVFKITPDGKFTQIYVFCTEAGCADGGTPHGGLIVASDGNFYGTTYYGGAHNDGTIFKITPAGILTTLHSFDGTHGSYPKAQPFQATNGIFYGTTSAGGSDGDGTIFSLDMGLPHFVETLPTSGKVGTNVIILGNDLTGTTGVTFNGTPATYLVISKSEIMAVVPQATSGEVQVTTPSGTLTSNANFRVTP
jgi:uncharacterized repeat protein (TIGR03803 family)